MKVIDKLANTGYSLQISRIYGGKILVKFSHCWVRRGISLVSEYGVGNTVNKAAKDYLSMIDGETLVFYPDNKLKEEEILFKL